MTKYTSHFNSDNGFKPLTTQITTTISVFPMNIINNRIDTEYFFTFIDSLLCV